MTDLEKLIEVLTDLEKEDEFICDGCVRANKSICIESLSNRLLARGVTVREQQKPLTLEELSDETDMYWVENEDGCFPLLLWDKSYCFSTFSQFGTEQDAVLNNDEYGKTWRCWAEKPRSEERKAAEWET